MVTLRGWIPVAVVWLSAIALFYIFFWHAWPHVVRPQDRVALFWSIACLNILIALCSLMETAVSSSHAYHFTEWHNHLPSRSILGRFFGARFRDYAIDAIRDKSKANAIIVLFNTILTILLSVVTLRFVSNVDEYEPLGIIDAANGFVIVGITLLIFVLGETIPKQLGLKYRHQTLLLIGALPRFFVAGRPIRWLADGITLPFVMIFGPLEELESNRINE